jgi:electron transfer flavoprotein beta subunit
MKRIIVCVKPVPDPKHWHEVSLDPDTGTLKRSGIPSIINPLDKHALEAALALKEAQGGEVVMVSMAPPFVTPALKEGLAMGADRAVMLSDPVFAGSDTLATAHILAAGCRWIGEFDLVICGNMTIDGSTGQVCSQLAEFLDLPNVMHVIDLTWQHKDILMLTQKIEHGAVTLKASLPIVISVRKELNKPRYTAFSGIIAAESKEIEVLSNCELALDPASVGSGGSPTKMAGLEMRRFERARERLEGSVEEIVEMLVEKLYQTGIL